MIFAKKKILVWCDDPPEDRVISIVAGCLANHDRAHSQMYMSVGVMKDNKLKLRKLHDSYTLG
jgi:hypothetical protein